jgi:dihydropteroate synthase
LGYPVLLGPSRKFFIRRTVKQLKQAKELRSKSGEAPEAVLFGTAAAAAAAILHGAHIIRVHDVRQMLSVARVADRLLEQGL